MSESTAGWTITRTDEDHRDLVTEVRHDYGQTMVSRYRYSYDEIGLRTAVGNDGTAFTNAAHNIWGYNDRGELVSAARYPGRFMSVGSGGSGIGNRAGGRAGTEKVGFQG